MKTQLLNLKIAATVVVASLTLIPFSPANAQTRRSHSVTSSSEKKSDKEKTKPEKKDKDQKRDVKYEKVEKQKYQPEVRRNDVDKKDRGQEARHDDFDRQHRTKSDSKYEKFDRPNRNESRDHRIADDRRSKRHYESRHHDHNDGLYIASQVYRTIRPVVVHANNRPRIVYRNMPRKAFLVTIDDCNYYYYKGRFFMASPRGYYLVEAPDRIQCLPLGTIQFLANGVSMYRYRDIVFVATPFGFSVRI